MVSEIVPTYYAAGTGTFRTELRGTGFSLIPSNAVAIISESNDYPMGYQHTSNQKYIFPITVIDSQTAVVEYQNALHFDNPIYVGGIVSEDRETIYWVNETRPLP